MKDYRQSIPVAAAKAEAASSLYQPASKWWWTKGTRKLSECGRTHTIHKQFLTWKRMIYYCLKVPNIYSSSTTTIFVLPLPYRHYSRFVFKIQIAQSWDNIFDLYIGLLNIYRLTIYTYIHYMYIVNYCWKKNHKIFLCCNLLCMHLTWVVFSNFFLVLHSELKPRNRDLNFLSLREITYLLFIPFTEDYYILRWL